MTNRCLLVGGGGFIGSNLAACLSIEGYKVTIYDRNLEQKGIKGPYTFVEGDFFSESNLAEVVRNQDIVIHLISGVSPASSAASPATAYKQDVLKTLELVECCKKEGVRKIVFLSSGGTVYGDGYYMPIKENEQTNPINHYGIMKLTVEKILLMYNQVYGMNNVIMRIGNPYGQGQNSKKKIGALTIFLECILNDIPITLYGKGEAVRDYIEISDVCDALCKAVAYETNNDQHPVFNVGTGVGTSISELIQAIERVTGKEAIVHYEEERAFDVKYNVLDTTKAQDSLGFKSRYSIEDGIRSLVEHMYPDVRLRSGQNYA